MNSRDEQFQPESIEEQLNRLEHITPQPPATAMPNVRLIKDVRAVTGEYTQSGKRVWDRLAERVARQDEASNAPHFLTQEDVHIERSLFMRTEQLSSPQSRAATRKRNPRRVLTLVASLLVAAVLVGTMVTILTLIHSHQSNAAPVEKKVAPTPTAKPLPIGTVVYTRSSRPGTNEYLYSIAWSPDGRRIATIVADKQSLQAQVHISDATTSGHLVTAPLAANSGGDMLWSPTGKYLLLYNLQTIAIVDASTGSTVNTIEFDAMSVSSTPGTHGSQLSSFIPSGGGFGFYSVTWTPDGASLAVAVSTLSQGKVELINPLTGAVQTTFGAPAYRIGFSLAFSSDGRYLAVSYPNDEKIVVWSVATQAVAFQQDGYQSETIAWQPGTHHLAGALDSPQEMRLWDIPSGKLLKTYAGVTGFIWSPDGTQLATYTSLVSTPLYPNKKQMNEVAIIDAASGTRVALYKSQYTSIMETFWSPDGRYIATLEATMIESSAGFTTGDTHILVWVA